MIDWLHELSKEWASYIRHNPKAYSGKNTVWRLYKEQGASGGDFGPTGPIWNANPRVIELHIAWRKMPEPLQNGLWGAYVSRGTPGQRAQQMGFKNQTEMYRHRTQAHYYALGIMENEKDLQKSTG